MAQGNTDLWSIDAARTTRFTFDPTLDRFPAWSPDGRSLLYTKGSPKTSRDVWVLPMALREPQGQPEQGRGLAGDPKPWPFLNSTFFEASSAFSPDGHWVAYQSDESGRNEIYVRP